MPQLKDKGGQNGSKNKNWFYTAFKRDMYNIRIQKDGRYGVEKDGAFKTLTKKEQVCNINIRKKPTLKARSLELTRAHHNNHKFLSPGRYEDCNSAANDVDSKYQSTSISLLRLI